MVPASVMHVFWNKNLEIPEKDLIFAANFRLNGNREVKMQTTSAPMAWLFLQENEQVQYLQKIALRAKNPSGPNMLRSRLIFCTKCNFLLLLRQHIFRQ
jgi:hypothetical protein